jgi:DHA1 family bicyclomycin/chloramphenicol resistance-like MFS transporter
LPVLLGFLIAVGPVSTDMYLPAFPAIERALGGAPGAAQLTLATWFAGLAVGQITQGVLSDRLGRRIPLIGGTLIYTLASIGCAVAPDLTTLALMRFVAAVGASASMVVPRAVVRDCADGLAAARMMSRLTLVMGVAPILAPTLGGFVLGFAGWQAIFWIAAAYGVLACALVWLKLPETLPPQRRLRQNLGAIVSRHATILTERSFATHALVAGCTSFALFAYLGGSPDAFQVRFHLTPEQFGMLFGCCAFAYVTMSQLNPRMVARFGLSGVLHAGVLGVLAGALGVAAFAAANVGPWWGLALCIGFGMASLGFTMPNAIVGSLSRHAAHAGSASAIMGTLQYSLGAASGLLVGVVADGTARPMAALMLAGSVGAFIADRARPRAEPEQPPVSVLPAPSVQDR